MDSNSNKGQGELFNDAEWIPDIKRIASLGGTERFRALYAFLLDLKTSGTRTTLTVYSEHAKMLRLFAELTNMGVSEAIGYLMATAAEYELQNRPFDLEDLKTDIEGIKAGIKDLGEQMERVTDTVLINAFGNLGNLPVLSKSESEELSKAFNDVDASAPKGAADGQ